MVETNDLFNEIDERYSPLFREELFQEDLILEVKIKLANAPQTADHR